MEIEKQESLGQFLRKNREEKNISIEQVAYATRISLKMLRALEDDDHVILPAPTFVRGYLQAYAKSAKLDTQDLLLRYQHHLATAPGAKKASLKSHYLYVKERYQEKKRMLLVTSLLVLLVLSGGGYLMLKSKRDRNKQLAMQAQQLQSSVVSSTKAEESKETKENKDVGAPAHVAAAVVVAESKLEKPAKEAKATKELKEIPEVKKVPAPVKEKEKEVAPVALATPPVPEESKKYNLVLKADQDVWLRCQTDDSAIKEHMVYAGKFMTLHANNVIKIFSGNLGALHATLNGQEIESLMSPTRPKSAVLPESEVAKYPLPLFPPLKAKEESATQRDESTDDSTANDDTQTSSDN